MALPPTPLMANILPPNATPYERALASEVQRLLDLDVPLRDLWSPERCPVEFLPYLAWTVSADLWKTDWPEFKKRQAVADAIELHRIKGTEEALRRYIDQVDARVLQVITPPQDFFAAADPNKEDLDAYVRLLPQLRLYIGHDFGVADGLFADEGFANEGFTSFDLGEALYGRRATVRKNGVDRDLKIVKIDRTVTQEKYYGTEQISLPGDAGFAFIADISFADCAFADAVKVTAELVTVQIDGNYLHETSELSLTTVAPGLDPVNPRYERDTDNGTVGDGLFADTDAADLKFATPDTGSDLMFDLLYLFDPDVASPLAGPGSFADHTRIGMDPFTAEVLIDALGYASLKESYSDNFFADQGFALIEDTDRLNEIYEAINVSKSLTDTVLVTFETTRPISLDDGIDLDQGIDFDARVDRRI